MHVEKYTNNQLVYVGVQNKIEIDRLVDDVFSAANMNEMCAEPLGEGRGGVS